MESRGLLAPVAAGVAVALAMLPLERWLGPGAAVPNATAWGTLASMAALPAERRRTLGWWLVVPGSVSLLSTALLVGGDRATDHANLAVLEVAALLLLIIHVVRWSTGPNLWVVAGITVAAQVLWLLRYLPERELWSMVAGCLVWGLGSAVAVVFGAYPRWAAARLRRSVASAREAQQRQLERDLHDYVAHDLSGMIIQAQAARYAAGDDPAQLTTALERIEEAGHRAMSSMDRALSLLRQRSVTGPDDLVRHPGLEDLSALVGRFNDTSAGSRAELTVAGDLASVPREVSEVLYRAGVEALTNVRRHGPADCAAQVQARVEPDRASLQVSSPLPAGATDPTRASGGTGLAQLATRAEALRGSLVAGPVERAWSVRVEIPFGAPYR